jgi:transposase
MKYVGVDLHKQTISLCVVVQKGARREVLQRQRLDCQETAAIERFFRDLGEFQVVVEATASYEWFVELLEPLAARVLLAHPRKLRVIAESTRKTDKLDAQVLAEFLALDMIPQAHRPTPRVRQHRALVRQRQFIQRRITSAKCKVRHILARYNADVKHLFTAEGRAHLAAQKLLSTDRFVVDQLVADLAHYHEQLGAADRRLTEFAKTATMPEGEARAILASIPCVGTVTIDIVLAELGDVRRFKNARQVAASPAWRPRSAKAPTAVGRAASPRKAPACCAGRSSKLPGGLSVRLAAGAWRMKNSSTARAASERSWPSPAACSA